jgi:hypothetical protein
VSQNRPTLQHSQAWEFIERYLAIVRYMRTMIPQKLWGEVPHYWIKNYKIVVTMAANGLSIELLRPIGGKMDKCRYRTVQDSIEGAIFQGLDYSLPPIFRIAGNNIKISQLRLVVRGLEPYVIIQGDGDIRFESVRFEAEKIRSLYPQEKDLLWFFSNASYVQITNDRAQRDAISDFWGHIHWLIFKKYDFASLEPRDIPKAIDVFKGIIEVLTSLLDQYHALITRQDLDEQMLQMFLENHYFLISPYKIPQLQSRTLCHYKTDFTLAYEDGSSTLVEIQLNNDILFSGNKRTDGLKEAIRQITDWFQWLKQNAPNRLQSTNGLIIIGRRIDYDSNKQEIDSILNSLGYPVSLLTYDDLEIALKDFIAYLVGKIASRTKKNL